MLAGAIWGVLGCTGCTAVPAWPSSLTTRLVQLALLRQSWLPALQCITSSWRTPGLPAMLVGVWIHRSGPSETVSLCATSGLTSDEVPTLGTADPGTGTLPPGVPTVRL